MTKFYDPPQLFHAPYSIENDSPLERPVKAAKKDAVRLFFPNVKFITVTIQSCAL